MTGDEADNDDQARLDELVEEHGVADAESVRPPTRDEEQTPRSKETGEQSPTDADPGFGTDTETAGPAVTGDMAIQESVELGVELLAHLERSVSLKEALDHLETITEDPAVTRKILDTAEMRGVIEREEGIVAPRSHDYVSFSRDVVAREGSFTCRRCGASISTGHFICFEAGEHGPFGSSCIRTVTGRDE